MQTVFPKLHYEFLKSKLVSRLVSFNEIAEANRRTFESRLEKAEVFLAQLNLKKEEELKKWRKKFDAMRKMSLNSMNSNPNIITKFKKRSRRQSSWDLGMNNVDDESLVLQQCGCFLFYI